MTEPILDDLASFNEEKKELEIKRKALYKKACARIQELVNAFGVKAEDIKFSEDGQPVVVKQRRVVPPKYKSPYGDETWTGRGITPKWYKQAVEEGFSEEDLMIRAE